MNKRVKVIILASLLLNLLLVGVIAGLAPRRLDARPTRQERIESALRNVPEPIQSRLRAHFSEIRVATEPLRNQMEDARAETLRVLSTEPFDEAAYDRQVKKIEELRAEMFMRAGGMLKETAKELSPDERRMLADVLRRPPPAK
jgi:uncharacterized membrane protein